MNIEQTRHFGRLKKKLNPHQIRELDKAAKHLIDHPLSGEQKKGDLSPIRVYKFRMLGQLCLLAYLYHESAQTICLLAVGPHENFYRDLKRTKD